MKNRQFKQLHLIRHAKSSWDNPGLADVDRPLNARGKKARGKMAKHIDVSGAFVELDSVFCSPAERAKQTIAGIYRTLEYPNTWQTKRALYTFNSSDIIQFCQGFDDNKQSLTIVGHNPALHDTVEYLTGETIEKFPTCAYAKLECNIVKWQELESDCASLAAFYYPKGLKK